MKKTRALLLTLVLVLSVVFALSSCEPQAVTAYRVSFIVDGEIYTVVTTDGETAVMPPMTPTKEGYTFDGWYLDNTSFKKPFDSTKKITSDVSVYAKWIEIKTPSEIKLTVSDFEDMGGREYYLAVANSVTSLDLRDKVSVNDGFTWRVYRDAECTDEVLGKSVMLNEGNNKYYLLVVATNGYTELYVLNVSRNPIYTVTFDTDGGTPVPSITVEAGALITAPETYKKGYTVSGWSYNFANPVTANVTVKASWTPIASKIKYDANGGRVNNAETSVIYDREYVLETPKRDGYVFDGWYLDGVKVVNGVWQGEESVTVVAKWSPLQYNVSYNLNGGKVDGTNPTKYTAEDTFTLINPTRSGYIFVGWTYNGCDEPTRDVTISERVGELNFIAHWMMQASYTVEYYVENMNAEFVLEDRVVFSGAVGDSVEADIKSIDHFSHFKNEYSILSGTISADSRLVLRVYYLRNVYNVVTTTNNHNGGSFTVVNDSYYYGEGLYLTATTNVGYTFLGWYDGETLVCTTSGLSVTVDKDVIYTAKWEAKKYTVTYDPNGGAMSNTEIEVSYDSYVKHETPVRLGYTFEGWYEGSVLYENGLWNKTSSVVLVAKWSANANTQYVVNHYKQNIENDEYTLADVDLLEGPTGERVTPDVKNYTGFTPPIRQTIKIDPNGTIVVDYYYTRNYYTVTLVKNGGAGATSITQKYGSTLDKDNWTAREGYTFGGWYTDELLTEVYNRVTMPAENRTLYAWWEEESKPTDFTYEIASGNVTVTSYVGSGTTIAVPTYIGDRPVVTIADYAFRDLGFVTKAVIPETVTSIGTSIFMGCNQIDDITVPFIGESINANRSRSAVLGYFFGRYTSAAETNPEGTIYQGWDLYSSSYPTGDTNGKNYHSSSYYRADYYYIPTSLKSVIVTVDTTVPYGAFHNCEFIETIRFTQAVTTVNNCAFKNCSGATEITVGTSLQLVGDHAFDNCRSLVKVNGDTDGVLIIPDSMTVLYDYSFRNCASLTKVVIGDSVTAIGLYVFNGCSSITQFNSDTDGELIIPAGVTTIKDYSFSHLSLIERIVVPDIVTSIGHGAFKGCNSLEDITLPFIGYQRDINEYNWSVFGYIFGMYTSAAETNPEGTIYQGWGQRYDSYPTGGTNGGNYYKDNYYYADYYYIPTSIKRVTITDDTTIPYGAFHNCYFIETIILPDNIVSIGKCAFKYCSGLTEMDLGTVLETIGAYAFARTGIIEITIPATITSIGGYAFDNCTALSRINSDVDGIIVLPAKITVVSEYTFRNCDSITKVILGENITAIQSYAFSYCDNIIQFNSDVDGEILIPEGITSIGDYAFIDLSLIKKIVVPDTVTSIGHGAFKGCNSLEDITLPFIGYQRDINEYNWSVFGYIFGMYTSAAETNPEGTIYQGWGQRYDSYPTGGTNGGNSYKDGYYYADYYYIPTSIKRVTITNDTTIPYGAFHNCYFIETIILPENIVSIGSCAFKYCTGLTKMDLGTSLESIGSYAFAECDVVEIIIPDTVTSIGAYAFYNCTALSRMNSDVDGVISLPKSLTSISDYTFYNCISITKVILGDKITRIRECAFDGCYSITQFNSDTDGELIIPEGVNGIGNYTFRGLDLITKLVVSDTVTSIGHGAFKGCNSLEDITLPFIGYQRDINEYNWSVFGYIFGMYTSAAETNPEGTIYQGWGQRYDSYPTGGTNGGNSYKDGYYYADYYYIPTSIKRVTITDDTTIPYGAFHNCDFIEVITIPEGASIGNCAFLNCNATVRYISLEE